MPSACACLPASKPWLPSQPNVRDQLFGIDWPLMWGMRNRIAHGYLLVDTAIVRQTLAQDVPTIIERIRGRITSL